MKKERLKIALIIILAIIALATGYYAYTLREKYLTTLTNGYNKSFSEAVNCINNVENFLAKTQITKTTECSAETLTEVWNDANLAMIYLSEIPFDSEGASQTIKFLNQVSDYSYLLAKKNLRSEELNDQDFENLKNLYSYTKELEIILNELSNDLYSGNISWKELQDNSSTMFAQEVGNINAFSSIDSTFDEYEGLIYDGAYSEHLNRNEKKALIGDELSEEQAKEKVSLYVNKEIENITSKGLLENADIQVYSFEAKIKDSEERFYVEITKVGGYLLQMNNSKDIKEEKISQENANGIGKEYLAKIGFKDMKETYFTKRENILTVNYAYEKNGVVYYPDLIKVKIALDDGEVLGVETRGYLNCHYERELASPQVSISESKSNLNPKLEIKSEGRAVIPVETGKEIYCYEFKGRVEDKDFLVYINVETGKEENILIILDTEGGTLTI